MFQPVFTIFLFYCSCSFYFQFYLHSFPPTDLSLKKISVGWINCTLCDIQYRNHLNRAIESNQSFKIMSSWYSCAVKVQHTGLYKYIKWSPRLQGGMKSVLFSSMEYVPRRWPKDKHGTNVIIIIILTTRATAI